MSKKWDEFFQAIGVISLIKVFHDATQRGNLSDVPVPQSQYTPAPVLDVGALHRPLTNIDDALRAQNRQLQQQADALRQEVQMLRASSDKTQAILASMNRSSSVMEWLSLIMAALTVVLLATGLYPILQATSECPAGAPCPAVGYVILAGIGALVILIFITAVYALVKRLRQPRPPKPL